MTRPSDRKTTPSTNQSSMPTTEGKLTDRKMSNRAVREEFPQFVLDIVLEIAPEGHSEQELGNCVDACAIGLSWHLAALTQASRRDELAKELMQNTTKVIESLDAMRGTMCTTKRERVVFQQAKEGLILATMTCDADVFKESSTVETGASQDRKLPPLVMPSWTTRRAGEVVRRLLGTMDADLRPGGSIRSVRREN